MLVNDGPARGTGPNLSQWEAVLAPADLAGPVTARAAEAAGNVEHLPYTVFVPTAQQAH